MATTLVPMLVPPSGATMMAAVDRSARFREVFERVLRSRNIYNRSS
jgi:hypothetical protein